MLAQRILVVIVLLPVAIAFAAAGGVWFNAFVALVMGLAAWEYNRLFRAGSYQPAGIFLIVSVVLLVLARGWNGFDASEIILSLSTLGMMAYHLVAYERGRDQAATDFGISMGGITYLGWIGAYLVSLRQLPDWVWWMVLALPTVWVADSAAYLVGRRWGNHKMCTRLSPKKSWEGYFAGAAGAMLAGSLIGWLYASQPTPAASFGPLEGAVVGLLLGLLTPLGDLGESMIKRQVGVKDSSHLLPGHGGVFDRIDSWLWSGVLSYYLITKFFY